MRRKRESEKFFLYTNKGMSRARAWMNLDGITVLVLFQAGKTREVVDQAVLGVINWLLNRAEVSAALERELSAWVKIEVSDITIKAA